MNSVAFSPDDGKSIVSGYDDNTTRLWDAESGEEIQGNSGRMVVALDEGCVRQGERTLLPGNSSSSVAFSLDSPPNKVLVAPCCDDDQWRMFAVLGDGKLAFFQAV